MTRASSIPAAVSGYPAVDPFGNERRFVLTPQEAVAYIRLLAPRQSPIGRDASNPISYTRTTYLDTDDLLYFHSCQGPVARRLRIREYALADDATAAPVLTGAAFLELKQIMGSIRSKVRLEAPPAVLAQVIEDGGRIQSIWSGRQPQLTALRAIQDELAGGRFTPQVGTWYRRRCLHQADGVRITLDEGLAFTHPQALGVAGDLAAPTDILSYGPTHILEVKSQGTLPRWVDASLGGLTEVHAFSKFYLGMQALLQVADVGQQSAARVA